MTNSAIKEPPIIQDAKLFSYLQEMARQINYASEQVEYVVQQAAASQGKDKTLTKEEQAEAAEEARKLRGLIEQTAYAVQLATQVETKIMESQYIALSEFGKILDTTIQTIVDAPEGQERTFYISRLVESLQQSDESLESYQTEATKYIKTGIIGGTDDDPIVGVAIGVASQVTTTETGGKKYEMTAEDYFATLTASKLSFWQNGLEVAYISNERLYITDAEITNKLRIGQWVFNHNAAGDLIISYQRGV